MSLDHATLELLRQSHPAWRLLRSDHASLVASIAPPEMMQVMRWMLPQLNAPERLELLSGLRAGAPAPVFQAVMDQVQPQLSPREWGKLAQGLGLPPVPGLVEAV